MSTEAQITRLPKTSNQQHHEKDNTKHMYVSNMLSTPNEKNCMSEKAFLWSQNSPETLQDFSETLENEKPSGVSSKLVDKETPFGTQTAEEELGLKAVGLQHTFVSCC